MTEDDWLASRHGQKMLAFVQTATTPVRTRWLGWMAARRFPVSARKIRLVEVACCDRIADLVPVVPLRNLIGVARQQAEEGSGTGARLKELERAALLIAEQVINCEGIFPNWKPASFCAIAAVGRLFSRGPGPGNDVLEWSARARAEALSKSNLPAVHERRLQQALAAEQAHQADLVREVIGNPFRPESIDQAWLSANDRAVTRIAEGIVQGGTFEDMPVLADALEDAGCTRQAMLDHCRGPGPHGVGCWVLDSVLGKS